LQEIFDSINFDFEHLYDIADNKTKRRINTYIEGWKEQGLLEGYFGMLASKIYNRTRVKNSEILELLIYSAYIEEQSRLNEFEQSTFKELVNHYYIEGAKEVNKNKASSVIPETILLMILSMPNARGYVYEDYLQATIKYNTDQIYRQAVICLQQQNNLEIENNAFQSIIKRQQNTKLCINEDKVSGMVDDTLIGFNNMAKIEGIKSLAKEDDAQVEFWAVTDENSTEMCQSMNGKRFYINKENYFDRYWGETKKELKIMRVRVRGLVPRCQFAPNFTPLALLSFNN